MGVSIYYSATRENPLTVDEKNTLDKFINKLNQQFPYKDEAEILNFYDTPSEEYIVEGSTKLTLDDEVILMSSIGYWLDALSQLTLSLPTAKWDVSIEDTPANWVDDHWEV